MWERRFSKAVSNLSTENMYETSRCHVSNVTESHVPSCACSPAEHQQSSSYVYRIIVFYASGMHPLIKECHLNWGFASLHMAGRLCAPGKAGAAWQQPARRIQAWSVQQVNRSGDRSKNSFPHLLATSSSHSKWHDVALQTGIKSGMLLVCGVNLGLNKCNRNKHNPALH